MRYLFVLFSILQTFSTLSQDANSVKKFPFQVLYAENAKNKAGQTLKSLDLVLINDVLMVGENGTLSLIHHTGFPIEVMGDTTIEINDLHNLIGIPQNNKKSLSSRSKIDYLFISNSSLARESKLSSTGACHDCGDGLEIIYPPRFKQFSGAVNYAEGICIKWAATNSKTYQVNFTNIFEDSLRSYITNSNELNLKGEDFRTLRAQEKVLLVEIKALENKKYYGVTMLKELPIGSYEFPYSCDLKKATFALMAGLYIEMLPQKYFAEAEKYFLLATELSDKPFYKEMLANFRKRTER